MGIKIKHKKLRDCEEIDLFDENIVVRFPKEEYKRRQDFVLAYGTCQICEESTDLDTPHHARQGLGVKDDRYLDCICKRCHGLIHTVGYGAVKKTREECESIGWGNNLDYIEQTNV